jgi:tetratricopeptide (TPR) repeat protein
LIACLKRLSSSRSVALPFIDEERLDALVSSTSAVAAQLRTLVGRSVAASDNPHERARYREAALAAERLSQVHYFLNEQNHAFGASLRCAQLAERLGPSPELARAYATLSVAMNFVPIPGLSGRYGDRAERVAEIAGDPSATGFVKFLSGLNACGAGRWRDARTSLEVALELALETGDVRSAQEIRTLLFDALMWSGLCEEALEHADRIRESGEKTKNKQALAWVTGNLAMLNMLQGHAREAVRTFEAASAMTAETGDNTAKLVESSRAIAHLMVGDWDEARRIADEIRALSGPPPAAWHCCQGYMAAAEVYLALWERAVVGEQPLEDYERLATDAVRVLERGAKMFPWAQSAALRLRGFHHWLSGRRRRALRSFRRAVTVGRDMTMPFDEAKAHFEIARHTGDPHHRDEHARRARLIYEQVGAAPWVELCLQLPRCWA